jgi:NADPH:quinone reductase-like Zn-dependent oxidoreductase
MGYDMAGVVAAVGTGVTAFEVGDEVYARLGDNYRGSIAEYALALDGLTVKKPKSLSFSQAASIPLASQTALQALDRGELGLPGGLKGKTVFIPAGLSGTGSFAVQLAKNCFGAGKVITTLSTGKISKIKELLGDSAPDQVVGRSTQPQARILENGSK